jgi:hypothetical protein
MVRLLTRPRACTLMTFVLIAGCGRAQQTETPVAAANITLGRADAAIGMPIEMNYRFVVAPNAPRFADDNTVFVHFLDSDGELMWTDDHQPPVPTTQWNAGQTIEYSRTMFVPKFPYSGETTVVLGLYSQKSGARVPLSGQSRGQREYQVASFNLHPQTDNLYVVFKDGWHETEVAEESVGIEWQWSKKNATLVFRNPMRDVLFYLQCDQPVQALGAPQHVELRIGPAVIDAFQLLPGRRELRKVNLTSAQLGSGETVEITVAVDRTFVPGSITQLKSTDSRELGVRVFRAYVQAK